MSVDGPSSGHYCAQLQGLADHTAEDVLLENRLLKSRMQDEKLGRQKADDDVKFLKQQLQSRDRTLLSVKEALAHAEQRNGQLQKLADDKEIQIADLTRKVAMFREKADELFFAKQRGELVSQPSSAKPTIGVVAGKSAAGGSSLFGAIASVAAGGAKPKTSSFNFKDRLHDIVTILRLKKKIRLLKSRHEDSMTHIESDLMAREDVRSQMAHECGTINKKFIPMPSAGDDEEEQARHGSSSSRHRSSSASVGISGARRSSLISFEGVRRHGRGTASQLPYKESFQFVTHEDKFVEAKIQASSFAAQLQPLRSDMIKHVVALKDFVDNSLSGLYYIFTDVAPGGRRLLAQPMTDYEKEIKSILTKAKILLFDVLKSAHGIAKEVTSHEKKVKHQWILDHRANHKDASVSADIPPEEDPRIAKQQEQLEFLKGRISQMQVEHTRTISDLELSRDAAESTTKFIHAKIFDLHDATYEALHAVFRQRYHWTTRFPNAFHGMDRKPATTKALAVKYNLKLGEAVSEDVQYLKKFTEYFLSDELFGADLLANGKDEANEAKKKDARGEGLRRRTIDAARAMSFKLDEVDILKEEWAAADERELRQFTRSKSFGDLRGGGVDALKENGYPPPPRVVRSACTSPELKPYRPATAGSQRSASSQAGPCKPRQQTVAAGAASTSTDAFHRMEEWQKHQHNVWEQKKQRPSVIGNAGSSVLPGGGGGGPAGNQEVMQLSKVTLQFDSEGAGLVDGMTDQTGGSARLARKGSFRRQLV